MNRRSLLLGFALTGASLMWANRALAVGPVLQALSLQRRKSTKAGAAAVQLAPMMVVGDASGITSWSLTQTSGPAGQFTAPTDGTCPAPVVNGVTPGTYTWNVTAQGSSPSNTVTLTIVVPSADGYTVATRGEMSAVAGSGGDTNATKINNMIVELARGATDFGVLDSTTGSGLIFGKWRCSGTSRCTVQHEDPNHPCTISRISADRCRNIDWVSLRVNNAQRYQSGTLTQTQMAAQKAWELKVLSSATTAPDFSGCRLLDTYGPCGVDGLGDPTKGINGLYFSVGAGLSLDVEIHGFTAYWVSQGISQSTAATSTFKAKFTKRVLIRYYTQNAVKLNSSAAGSYHRFESEVVALSPMTDPTLYGVHADFFQVTNSDDVTGFYAKVVVYAIADGDHSSQTVFTRSAAATPSDYTLLDMTIDTFVSIGRSIHSMTLNGSDATHQINIGQATLMRQASGRYGVDNAQTKQSPPGYFPQVRLDAGHTPANTHLKNLWIHDVVGVNPNGVDVSNNIVQFAQNPDVSSVFPNATWICSPTIQSLVVANTDVQNYAGVDDARWYGSDDEVLALISASLSPVLDGSMKNGDGTYKGAFFPNGAYNDGSVYSAVPPTTITATATGTAEVGEAIIITFTLDQPATAAVTVTAGASGVAGSFVSNTAVIPIGQTSATATFTPSAAGTLTITATNDRSLTNPAPLAITVTAAAAPTIYTMTLDRLVAAVGQRVTVSLLLNRPATQAVTISLAKSAGLTGSFASSSVVIGVGQVAGSTSFTPSAPGAGTISTSDDRGLTDPADQPLVALPGVPSRGALLKYGVRP